MITECGFGVAMGNATDDVKAAADCVTLSNEEEGVAYAIRTLLFEEKGSAAPAVPLRRRLAAWLRGRRTGR